MKKEEIMSELLTIEEKLMIALNEIKEKNTGDNQFDYVTNPAMADYIDRIERLVSKIEKIVYQK